MARELSSSHLDKYKKGKELFKLFNVVQKDPELSFEIRRNDEVIIYYCKKKLLTISQGKRITPLDSNYLKGNHLSVDISDKEALKSETKIKKYFKEAKKYVYEYSKKSEFAVQQNIALGSRSFDKGLLVVDMEWEFSQSGTSKRISTTRIDLVAFDPKPNKEGLNDIYLVEVKHSLDATHGPSGMQDHVDKTFEICQCKEACEALVSDVKTIIDQKTELGILKGTKPAIRLATVPKMMFFLSYRSKKELEQLEKEVADLKIPKGMDEPAVIYHNYTIQLHL